MKRTVLSTFLFVAILGLGCIGVVTSGQAYEHCEDTSDPRYDPNECDQESGGGSSGDFEKGLDAYKNNNYAKALSELKPLAKQGHARAQFYLGDMYNRGFGVPQHYKSAAKWIRLAAEQGNAPAMLRLGVMYQIGQGVPQDEETALEWYRLAAEQGDAVAQFGMGNRYKTGNGVPRNYKTALKWYRLAAKQGHTRAQYGLEKLEKTIVERQSSGDFRIGMDSYKRKDYATALREFKLLAKDGHARAKFRLGWMYENGHGVPQDDKTAVKWYRLAAKQGVAFAYETAEYLERRIAVQNSYTTVTAEKTSTPSSDDLQKGFDAYDKGYFAFGRGDYAAALREWEPLAEQGDDRAQFRLGRMYEYGDGVLQDYKTALKWYRRAAKQGHTRAQNHLEILENKIAEQKPSPTVTAEKTPTPSSGDFQKGLDAYKRYDYATALREFRPLAEQGHVDAQFRLGIMYEYGEGVPKDYRTAVKWYRLAAEQGDTIAQNNLDTLQRKIAKQKPSPTVTAEKTRKPKVDQQKRLELARRTQEALQVLGLYSGKLDGIIGVKTRSAIQQWQKRNGYAGTGELTEVLLSKLEQKAITQLAEKKPETKVANEKPKLAVIPSIEFGDYHALVIGNDNYPHMNNLENAVQDAKDVSAVLKRLYGFQVRTLLNATRSDIFGALESYRAELTSDSNLLIYYAGHGYVDEITDIGYWQPVDSDEISKSNWIPNSVVTNELKAIRAKHVMVIADSCYSGTLVRSSTKGRPTAKDTEWYKRMAEKRSRTAMVSGGIEPVMDGGGGKNSVFAKALLDVLRDNQSIMDGAEVFERLKRPVVLASEQTPEYADIRLAGHDGGHFLLVRQDAITEQPNVSKGADALERAKKQCSELGFTKGTEKHGQCVMKLYK